METTAACRGLRCTDCGARHDLETTRRCPDCGGVLEVTYDHSTVDLDREALPAQPFDGLGRYADVLPFPRETLVTLGEGTTPLVDAPGWARRLGVERVLIKDEGANPTGSIADRGAALAVTAAKQHGATTVALPSTGNAAQATSAYAARAGLDAEVFVPSRAGFDAKAMTNVHGGELSVVGGRFDDAVTAFEDARSGTSWYSLAAFETPYRQEGAKTTLYEIAERLDWGGPDHVVHPTGSGVGLVGLARAASELDDLGWIDAVPALHAVQPDGCGPIAEAFENDRTEHEPVEHPDTICGGLEIADPPASRLVLEAVRESGGSALARPDSSILEAAVEVAQTAGVEVGTAGGAAASGAVELAERGVFDEDETVVLVNPAAGNRESDVLRSHLMSKGI
ncbi:Threonine synthase and cysteate synthase [Halapricum desulfuricans]|uniref:Threonine synthase and cysteate synthase n=1 Tax=Halapricum desulfuricans TaxID=2841257 RepID=A0A897NJM1_9EURY|nr:threonine synthase [Halapricum desulfuricans]QSG11143.1 Threonine synthase and cysteate synthase [Halapricum desulfuricans]